MKRKSEHTVQEWIPFERILPYGIVQLKNKTYIKIIKISPINFNLKSRLEQEAILNSYKIFLKTCNFHFQILIQSNKEDLKKHIQKVNKNLIQENDSIQKISKQYIEYIKNLNHDKKSSSKNFYMVIKEKNESKEIKNFDDYATENLNDKYFKIKDCLSRCGNMVTDINEKEELLTILYSFLNSRIYFSQI